ncbi:MAG: hypothetical protein K2X66_02260 [Cyanobacteria bacterium]|nr:hypothetical protein [Cyanobacteriota bacterium]
MSIFKLIPETPLTELIVRLEGVELNFLDYKLIARVWVYASLGDFEAGIPLTSHVYNIPLLEDHPLFHEIQEALMASILILGQFTTQHIE